MKNFSPILQDLIEAFKQLPGIGIKSAQRIVFHLLQDNTKKALVLAETLNNSLVSIKECKICRMYSEEELCQICKDNKRGTSFETKRFFPISSVSTTSATSAPGL